MNYLLFHSEMVRLVANSTHQYGSPEWVDEMKGRVDRVHQLYYRYVCDFLIIGVEDTTETDAAKMDALRMAAELVQTCKFIQRNMMRSAEPLPRTGMVRSERASADKRS
jgi:hypothetical protein